MWINNIFKKSKDVCFETNIPENAELLEILKRWEQVSKFKPQDIEARINLIDINKKLSRIDISNSILNKLIKDHPEHRLVKILIARKKTEDGRHSEAIECWNEISKNNPDNIEALVQLASLNFKKDNMQEVIHLVDLVLQKKPKNIRALGIKAKYYTKIKKYESAIETWYKLIQLTDKNFEAEYQVINCNIMLENYSDSLLQVNKAIETYPTEYSLKISRCKILLGTNKTKDALSYIDAQISKEPHIVEYVIEKARILFMMDRFDEAELLCNDTLERVPNDIRLLTLFARIAQKRTKQVSAA